MAKKVCLYGILSALCIVFGFVEHLVSLDFIAPGVKLGLANSVSLILIALGDIKGACAVNIVRILLSGMLFSSPYALIFSLSGGVFSMCVMTVAVKCRSIGFIGVSIVGAVAHNFAQLICASVTLGAEVWYYSAILLFSALFCGIITGTMSKLVFKKLNIK